MSGVELFLLTGGTGLLLLAGGLAFLFVGVRRLERPSRVGWHSVTGTVVDWEAVAVPRVASDQAVERMVFPIVEYPLPDGTRYRFRNPTTFDTGVYLTGRAVEVLVDPADPRRAEMAATQQHHRWIGGMHSCLGAALTAFGATLLLGTVVLAVALV